MLLYSFSGVHGFWWEVSGFLVCKWVFPPLSGCLNFFSFCWFSEICSNASVVCVCVYTAWGSLSLGLWVDSFNWIWKTFDFYVFIIFFFQFLYPSPWYLLQTGSLAWLSSVGFGCFVYIFSVILYLFSVWLIYTPLFKIRWFPLTPAPAVFNCYLLLDPFSEFFTSVIFHF